MPACMVCARHAILVRHCEAEVARLARLAARSPQRHARFAPQLALARERLASQRAVTEQHQGVCA